jgi:hypothetical protein
MENAQICFTCRGELPQTCVDNCRKTICTCLLLRSHIFNKIITNKLIGMNSFYIYISLFLRELMPPPPPRASARRICLFLVKTVLPAGSWLSLFSPPSLVVTFPYIRYNKGNPLYTLLERVGIHVYEYTGRNSSTRSPSKYYQESILNKI